MDINTGYPLSNNNTSKVTTRDLTKSPSSDTQGSQKPENASADDVLQLSQASIKLAQQTSTSGNAELDTIKTPQQASQLAGQIAVEIQSQPEKALAAHGNLQQVNTESLLS